MTVRTLITAAALVAGMSISGSAACAQDGPKALASFKAIAAACGKAMVGQSYVSDYYKPDWERRLFAPGKVVSFDVKATDSLIAPFIGVVVVTQVLSTVKAATEAEARQRPIDAEDPGALMTYQFDLAYRDDKWVVAPDARSVEHLSRRERGGRLEPSTFTGIVPRANIMRQPSEFQSCVVAMDSAAR